MTCYAQSTGMKLLCLARALLLFLSTVPLYSSQLPIRLFTTRDGLPRNTASCLVTGSGGMMWLCTTEGLARFDGSHFRVFGEAEGLPPSGSSISFQPAPAAIGSSRGAASATSPLRPSSVNLAASSNPLRCVGAFSGLAEYDPSREIPTPHPAVYFTRVRVRGEDGALPWDGARTLALDLPADRNQVEIEWVVPDLGETESLRYQYRMANLDDPWSEPTERVSLNYAALPAGRFRFQVRAVGQDMAETGGAVTPAELVLDVAAPYWRRWWFLLSAVLALSALAAALYHYRVGHLLAMERLRTRIASDLHDDMGLQPHPDLHPQRGRRRRRRKLIRSE